MPDQYTLKLGRRTAKLLLQCISSFYHSRGFMLTEEERTVLCSMLQPLKEWVDKGPALAIEIRVVDPSERGASDWWCNSCSRGFADQDIKTSKLSCSSCGGPLVGAGPLDP